MEVDEDSLPDSGLTIWRAGVLTAAGRHEHISLSQDVDSPTMDVVVARRDGAAESGTSRRALRWAVDVQPASSRPASCKLCGVPFATNDVRLSSWGSRSCSKWCCVACLAGAIPEAAEFEPHGKGTQEHVDAVRQVLQQCRRAEQQVGEPHAPEPPEATNRQQWDAKVLPNKEWWARLSLVDASRLGIGTFVQIPDRFRGAFVDARRKVLEVLAEARQRGDACEEWKCFLVFELLLLSRSRNEGTCAELLEERLAWIWGGQWGALWASAKQCRSSPPGTKRASDKQIAARVQTLGASGEEGRALVAANAGRLAPRTQVALDKIRRCFPEDEAAGVMPPSAVFSPSQGLLDEVAAAVSTMLRRPPKLTAPGLLGTRLEHLSLMVDDPWAHEQLAVTVACLVPGQVPHEILQALRVGQVVAFEKDGGEVRPLLVGGAYRRLGLRALMQVKKKRVADAVGLHQYGVGRKNGADCIVKALQALAEVRPSAAFIKVDIKAAFQSVIREVAFGEVESHDAELASILRLWYKGPVDHLWRNAAGRFETVTSERGFDQGCPLAAAAFSIAQRGALERLLQQMQLADPLARLYSYLDDTYVVVESRYAFQTLQGLQSVLTPLGLELKPSKTFVWCPAGAAMLPADVAAHSITELPVLGAYLRSHGDAEGTPHQLGRAEPSIPEAIDKLKSLCDTLKRLQAAGLKRQAAAALIKSYAGPASQHALRLSLATEAEAMPYDEQLRTCWSELSERNLDQTSQELLGLPVKLGGVGAQFATDRRCAAFVASWSAVVNHVAQDIGCSTVADALERMPVTNAKLSEARQGLHAQGVRLSEGAPLADALQYPVPQALVMEKVQKNKQAALQQALPTRQGAEVLGAGGPGAGGFLAFPSEPVCAIENVDWSTALRQRLHCPRAECAEAELATASLTCRLCTAEGVVCGMPLDERGFHSCTCQSGGGVLRRHGRVNRGLGSLVTRWRMVEPLYEQRVPSWDRPSRSQRADRDPIERAVLDLEYPDDDGRKWIDVSIRHPAAGTFSEVATASRRAGEAARRGEREKHARYPGERLVPFVVECGGRLGGEARLWLRDQVQNLPEDMQIKELARAHRLISCALQGQIARQLRKAAGLK